MKLPRFYCPSPLVSSASLTLPAGAARHIQVLRLQPGGRITLFNGEGGEWMAAIEQMGRSDVKVRLETHHAIEREAARPIHLAIGMPANERMDWLVEKATELGAASIQPLVAERNVLKLAGERAAKKRSHWQAIAVAACEQSGRNQVPLVHAPVDLASWCTGLSVAGSAPAALLMLSLRLQVRPVAQAAGRHGPVLVLSGPEGGFTANEEQAALDLGFIAVTLGPRVLRAETAPLAVLAALTLTT